MQKTHYSFLLIASLILSGCQLTDTLSNKNTNEANDSMEETSLVLQDSCDVEHIEHKDDSQCSEPTEGVNEVIHPVDDAVIPELVSEEVIEPENNLWHHIANQLEFSIPENQRRLEVHRNWYLKHPSYMKRVSKRAAPFLYYIVNRLEQENLPLDLALLPIVESAFDPFAYSHGRAAGMWQFIPGTAKRFGMQQTWWYDGRRDVIASTEGAIKYLRYLNKFFDGNWMHALAAYNSGEGRVRRAIRKNQKAGKPTDFWSLDLPRETRAYVPKLLALADILKRHEEYSFDWPTIENAPVIQVVDIDSQLDLSKAASLAGLTTTEIQALNPGFNRWATDPDGPFYLVLPLNIVSDFKQNLAATPKENRLNWVRHKIKSGESLQVIAKRYHTTVDIIQEFNNVKGSTIYAGQYLLVPKALSSLEDYTLSADQRLEKIQNLSRSGTKVEHIVQTGDTLWDLSREYKVSVRDIAKWNKMAPRDPLKVGNRLVIWTNGNAAPQGITRNITYRVRNGDSLSRIANKFKVSVRDLLRWNNLDSKKYLQPGQRLKITVDITNT